MAITRSQLQRGLFPGIRELIFRGYREFPEEFSQLFNMLTSNAAFEEDLSIAGVGLAVKTPEMSESAEDQFDRGYAQRYQHDKYTLRIGVSYETRQDDKTGYWRERAPDLGYSFRQTKEIQHAGYIENGFTDSTGPDNVSLFSSVHPNPGKRGGTQSNILSPVGSITVLNVRLALTAFRRFYDDTGIRRRQLMAKWLVHPPEQEYNVLEILRSAGRPDTANRADNVIRNALSPFTWDYLTDPDNWYLFSDKGQHKLKSYTRESFDVREYMDNDTETHYVKGQERYSFGHSHWIGTLGSNPP